MSAPRMSHISLLLRSGQRLRNTIPVYNSRSHEQFFPKDHHLFLQLHMVCRRSSYHQKTFSLSRTFTLVLRSSFPAQPVFSLPQSGRIFLVGCVVGRSLPHVPKVLVLCTRSDSRSPFRNIPIYDLSTRDLQRKPVVLPSLLVIGIGYCVSIGLHSGCFMVCACTRLKRQGTFFPSCRKLSPPISKYQIGGGGGSLRKFDF